MFARLTASLLCLAVPLAWAGAAAPLTLKWHDLQPDDPALRATLSKLPKDKLERLLRAIKQENLREAKSPQLRDANAALMKEDFSDIKPLALQVRAFDQRRLSEMQTQRDGQQVQLDGYLLPLQQQGKKVTEFLLVPVVGACIHVPPPPPNQMVSVKFPAGFEQGGLYTPVTVRGTLRVQPSNPKLTLVDGSANISVGYSLSADAVQAYQKPKS